MTCGRKHRNPSPTVDTVIRLDGGGVVLIKRKNPPSGWALPGGFVDYGETVEHAAVREAKEETGLEVELVRLLGVYSDPTRDSRQHTISTVFVARASGTPMGGDDAAEAAVFNENDLPAEIAFDHRKILEDYFSTK
ncbi:bifunctional NMN adenylyltransferase/Nudix hydrolase [bacterium BMS3Abin14]|nr:bifunctional NMN adenylyltransferase/Nudix hydrolase [bacterium BMS3Abin14]